MLLYVLRRLILLLLTLAFASLVVFGVLEVLPGNAAQTMLGTSATPEAVAALGHKLGLVQAAILTRVTRSALVEALNEDFMRTARAKGLSRNAALWRHALPNALPPILTIVGLQSANLVAGAVVVENVFVLPGLGRLIVQSIANRDVLVVEDCVMGLAAFVIAVNLLVDLVSAAIDPRLRAGA